MKNHIAAGEEQSKSGCLMGQTWKTFVKADFCKPIARRQPDVIIIHVGTKDLRIKDDKEIVKNILAIKNTITQLKGCGGALCPPPPPLTTNFRKA